MNLTNTVLIACEMQKKEIEYAIKHTGYPGQVIWMKKSLHEKPKLLNKALQDEIDKHQELEAILLGFGLCGNGTLGLISRNTALIIPKFDDCIRMLLSPGKNCPIPSKVDSLYYTDGWVDSADSLLADTNSYDIRYGHEKGARFTKLVLGSYKSLTFIETGFYDVSKCCELVQKKCTYCNLKIEAVSGNIRVLIELLSGTYDDEFVIKAPGEMVELWDFDGRPRCVF